MVEKIRSAMRGVQDEDRFRRTFEAQDQKANGTVHARSLGRILRSLKVEFDPGDLREALEKYGDGRMTLEYVSLLDDAAESPKGAHDGDAEFAEGDRVEARFRGGRKYFKGTIERIQAGETYQIQYDDGDMERNVDASLIRALERQAKMAAGGRGGSQGSEVELSNLLGDISRVPEKKIEDLQDSFEMLDPDGTGLVSMREFERCTERARIGLDFQAIKRVCRTLEENGRVRYSAFIKALRRGTLRVGSPSRSARNDLSLVSESEDDAAFRKGDIVEARFRGGRMFFKGFVSRAYSDGSCDIDYDNGDKERRVSSSNIRKLGYSSENSPRDKSIHIGDRVEARFKGGRKYFKGIIRKASADGTFAIDYDDGDREFRVKQDFIRLFDEEMPSESSPRKARSNSDFKEGQRVEARFRGGSRFHPGTIERCNSDGSYDIYFNDGKHQKHVLSNDIRIKPESLQPLRKGQKVEARFKGGKRYYGGSIARAHPDGSADIDYDDGDSERRVPADRIRASNEEETFERESGDQDLQNGDLVEALFRGGRKYYPGKISKVRMDGNFDIEYDDGDFERSVPLSKIRKRTTKFAHSGQKQFMVGDNVKAKFRGGRKFFPGKITRVNPDGTFSITYADGDRERSVPEADIRKEVGENDASMEGRFSKGDEVEAKSPRSRRWKPGRVLRMNQDGSFDVSFQDGETGRRIEPLKIRKAPTLSPVSHEASSDEFQVGDRVEARFKGGRKFFPGEIVRANVDGSFSIVYDDVDRETRVPRQFIRKLKGNSSHEAELLEVGTRVEARFKNGRKYFKGEITRKYANGKYDISYDDGDRERMVSRDNIRIIENTGTSLPKLAKGSRVEARFRNRRKFSKGEIARVNGDGTFDVDFDDGCKERRVLETNIKILDEEEPKLLRKGDRVKAKFRGGRKMYNGTIERVLPGGLSDVKFDDGDFERGIPIQDIQKVDDDFDGNNKGDFRIHDRVEALYKNGRKYYPGKITKVNRDGTFAILYDDGDRELRVKASQVKPASIKQEFERETDGSGSEMDLRDLRTGDVVEARFRGGRKYFKGRITRARVDGTFDIAYDDGDRETHVKSSVIRKIGGRESVAGAQSLAEILKRILKKGFRRGAIRNYKEVFCDFDLNGDGYLSRIEFGHALDKLGLKYTKDELGDLIRALDQNRDGRVSYREFLKLLQEENPVSPSGKTFRSPRKEPNFSEVSEDSSSDSSNVAIGKERPSRERSPPRVARRFRQKSPKKAPARKRSPSSRSQSCPESPVPAESRDGSSWSEASDGEDGAESWGSEDVTETSVLVKKFEIFLGSALLKDKRKMHRAAFERIDRENTGKISRTGLQKAVGSLGIEKKVSAKLFAKLISKYGRGSRSSVFYKDLVMGCRDAAEAVEEDVTFADQMKFELPKLRRFVASQTNLVKEIQQKLDKHKTKLVRKEVLSKFIIRKAHPTSLNRGALMELMKNFTEKDGQVVYEDLIAFCCDDPVSTSTTFLERAQKGRSLKDGIRFLREKQSLAEKSAGVEPIVLQTMDRLRSLISDLLNDGSVNGYAQVFELFDCDKDGKIGRHEMFEALQRFGFDLSNQEVAALLLRLDKDGEGNCLDYRHFLMFAARGTDGERWTIDPASGNIMANTYAGELESTIRQKIRKQSLKGKSGRQSLLKAFKNLDREDRGYIKKRALVKLASNHNWRLTNDDVTCLCARFDLKEEDSFDYKSFVNFLELDDDAIFGVEQRVQEFVRSMEQRGTTAKDCFGMFDRNGDGKISVKELCGAMLKLGLPVSEDEAKELVRRVDIDRDGKICFAEFVRAFASPRTPCQESERSTSNLQPVSELIVPDAKVPLAPRGSVGEWLENTASPLEKRNFFAFLHVISSFEKQLGLQQNRPKTSNMKEELVLQLGTSLKVRMNFSTS